MNELKLYRCMLCGNLIWMVEDAGVVPVCCGEEMTPVAVNTVDGASEKHVPVICREGKKVKVSVGLLPHPMTEAHYISRIALVTDKGIYLRYLSPGDEPEVKFKLCSHETALAAYAWCNIHGFWMGDACAEEKEDDEDED